MPKRKFQFEDVPGQHVPLDGLIAQTIQPITTPPTAATIVSTPTLQEHDLAVQAFEDADALYKNAEQFITSGQFLQEIFTSSGGDLEKMKREWDSIWAQLRTLLEDRNAKRKTVTNVLRPTVALAPSQERGWDGKPTVKEVGHFTVTSKTKRSFDDKDLISLLSKRGLLDSLLALKSFDQKTGKEYAMVEQRTYINYSGVKNWLQQNNLEDVLKGAYKEEEDTPAVTGPRELYFLGDEKKSGD